MSDWQATWRELWGTEPPRSPATGSSPEWALQTVIGQLVTGKDESLGYDRQHRLTGSGSRFFASLLTAVFGDPPVADHLYFTEELSLPIPEALRRSKDKSRAPDYGVLWPGRLLLIELKGVVGTMKTGQVEEQLQLARLTFPSEWIDHIYVTPVPARDTPPLDERMRYSNLMWPPFVGPLLAAFNASPEARRIGAFVSRELNPTTGGAAGAFR